MSKQQRLAVFTSACCTGWAYAYDADSKTQDMIKKHAHAYGSTEAWQKRGCDGSVTVYDNIDISRIADDMGIESPNDLQTLEDLFALCREDGDGRIIDAAWIVHMLLSDATADGWLPS